MRFLREIVIKEVAIEPKGYNPVELNSEPTGDRFSVVSRRENVVMRSFATLYEAWVFRDNMAFGYYSDCKIFEYTKD